MQQTEIKIKAKGKNCQAAYSIFNQSINVFQIKNSGSASTKKLFEWLMWFFLLMVILSVLSSPFIKEVGSGLFIFLLYVLGFVGFLISLICATFFSFKLKNEQICKNTFE